MAKTGRPLKYKPEYADQAKKLCILGATDVDLADFFGVCIVTLNSWKHKYPEFLKSLKVGKKVPDERVERSLYQRATGYSTVESKILSFNGVHTDTIDVIKHYPPDTTACIFWLKNRMPKEYRDKVEVENSEKGVVDALKELAEKLPV